MGSVGRTIVVLFVCGVYCVRAQGPSVPSAFETVSILPLPASSPLARHAFSLPATFRGGRFRSQATTAQALILLAFKIQDWQVVAAPPWVATERFSIEATTDSEVPIEKVLPELPGMLRAVLRDRFK